MQETCRKTPNNETTDRDRPKLQLIKVLPKERKKYKRDIKQIRVLPLCGITRKPLGLCHINQIRENLTKKNQNLPCGRNNKIEKINNNVKNYSGQPAQGGDDMFFNSKNLKLKTLDFVSSDDPIKRRNFYSYVRKYNKRHPNGSAFEDISKFMEMLRSTHSKASLASVTTVFLRIVRLQLGILANTEHNRQLLEELRKRYKVPTNYITKRALSLTEVRTLVSKAKPKASALTEFLFHTSFRIGDSYKIKLDNCRELENGNWLVATTQKGQKKNEIEVRKAVFMKVRNVFKGKKYLFECQKTGEIYTHSGIRLLFTREAKRILGGKISTHDMRRAFATNLIKLGFNCKEIMKRMGLASYNIFLGRYVDEEAISVVSIPSVSKHDADMDEAVSSLSVESIPVISQEVTDCDEQQLLLFSEEKTLIQAKNPSLPKIKIIELKTPEKDKLSFGTKERLKELKKLVKRIDRAREQVQVTRMPRYAHAV